MAINQFGCKDSITKQVTIDFLLNQFFPTAFTPDGDNVNDTFNFVATGIIDSTFEMLVFDKWGGQVFQTNDVRQGWDGKSPSGLSLPAGVYAYKVFFYDQSGKKRQIKGRFIIYS
jgi:gliding motility-associated-like protein